MSIVPCVTCVLQLTLLYRYVGNMTDGKILRQRERERERDTDTQTFGQKTEKGGDRDSM